MVMVYADELGFVKTMSVYDLIAMLNTFSQYDYEYKWGLVQEIFTFFLVEKIHIFKQKISFGCINAWNVSKIIVKLFFIF